MKTVLPFRIDEKLKEEAEKQAKRENRALSNFIETVVFKYIQEVNEIKAEEPFHAPLDTIIEHLR